jgi:hypothetical protein
MGPGSVGPERKALISLRWLAGGWAVAGVLALAGVAVQLYATSNGAGVSPDSVYYLTAAENIIRGYGLQYIGDSGKLVPLVLWQPLYPLLLSASRPTGITAWEFGRFFNAGMAASNLVLAQWLVWRASGRRWSVAWAAAIILLATPTFIEVHSWIWSESPMMFAGFCGLGLLDVYLVSGKRLYLVVASLSISAAVMLRYAALGFPMLGIIALLLPLGKRPLRMRVWDGLFFLAIIIIPVAGWMIRNALQAGSALDRSVGFYPGALATVAQDGFGAMVNWLSPGRMPGLLRSFIAILILILWATLAARRVRQHLATMERVDGYKTFLPELMAGYVLAHFFPIIASAGFLSPGVNVDERTMVPALVAAVLLSMALLGRSDAIGKNGGSLIAQLKRPSAQLAGRLGILIGLALLIAMNGVHTLDWVSSAHQEGIGYATLDWQSSTIMEYLRSHTGQALLMSNGPDIIYFLTGRQAMMLPATSEAVLQAGLQSSGRLDCDVDPVWIVYFRGGLRRFKIPSERDLATSLDLDPIYGTDYASIYCLRGDGS